jgi:hypothetical protein
MNLENISYLAFGNNLVIGSHIRRQLTILKKILPSYMKHREMDDLGCGDGKVTLLLQEILEPTKLRGFDINQRLVKLARGRGIDAHEADLKTGVPDGELAVLWGTLHHVKKPEACLEQLSRNYPFVFIREPISTGCFHGMELGHPLKPKDLTVMLKKHLPQARIYYCGANILIFYRRPDDAVARDNAQS